MTSSSYIESYIELMGLRSVLAGVDRWSFKPGLVSLGVVAALVLVCELPGSVSFLMIPLSLLGYAVGAIAVLFVSIYLVVKKRPRRSVSVFLVLLLPVLLWTPILRVAEFVHLGLTAGFGVGYYGILANPNSSSFIAYDWSVGLAGQNTFLIHDVTDEIALPVDQHTHSSSYDDGLGGECAGKVRRLIRHYYICSF